MMRDLAVVVPDKDIEQSIRRILARHQSLGIRKIDGLTVQVHSGRDPGVWKSGHELLQMHASTHRHGLILLDHAFDGMEADPLSLQSEIENRCRADWQNRARCIVIDPEIEAWVWSDSIHVANVLGWSSLEELRSWLHAEGLWNPGDAKPKDPQRAFEKACVEKGTIQSSSIFGQLAEKVSFTRCRDRSFNDLRTTLQAWFSCAPSDA